MLSDNVTSSSIDKPRFWYGVLSFLMFAFIAAAAAPQIALAGNVWLPDGGGVSNVQINSIRERKFSTIIKQQFDFSCGSAALATLLTYHYEEATTEQQAFSSMYEKGDIEKIKAQGFSLLDIKNYLEEKGYQADGYQSSLATLAEVGVPAIALVNVQGYKHFVVIKGLQNDEVLVGDPALGLRFIPKNDFEAMWENNILFIIRNRSEIGQKNFNADADWKLIARAPLGEAISRETLESVTFGIVRFGDVAL